MLPVQCSRLLAAHWAEDVSSHVLCSCTCYGRILWTGTLPCCHTIRPFCFSFTSSFVRIKVIETRDNRRFQNLLFDHTWIIAERYLHMIMQVCVWYHILAPYAVHAKSHARVQFSRSDQDCRSVDVLSFNHLLGCNAMGVHGTSRMAQCMVSEGNVLSPYGA